MCAHKIMGTLATPNRDGMGLEGAGGGADGRQSGASPWPRGKWHKNQRDRPRERGVGGCEAGGLFFYNFLNYSSFSKVCTCILVAKNKNYLRSRERAQGAAAETPVHGDGSEDCGPPPGSGGALQVAGEAAVARTAACHPLGQAAGQPALQPLLAPRRTLPKTPSLFFGTPSVTM